MAAGEGGAMTGHFIRVRRDGQWRNVEIEHLTGDEMTRYLDGVSEETAKNWVQSLAHWIRENVQDEVAVRHDGNA